MKSTERQTMFNDRHHDIHNHLESIEWLVFGTVEFDNKLSHQESNDQRAKQFFSLMNSLAVFARVKTKRLVYFQNNEIQPSKNFHHIHFLLGPQGLERFTADTVSEFLTEKAVELKFSNTLIEPFDPKRDGVGYVTKKVLRNSGHGRAEELDLDHHCSRGLVNLWKKGGLL